MLPEDCRASLPEADPRWPTHGTRRRSIPRPRIIAFIYATLCMRLGRGDSMANIGRGLSASMDSLVGNYEGQLPQNGGDDVTTICTKIWENTCCVELENIIIREMAAAAVLQIVLPDV